MIGNPVARIVLTGFMGAGKSTVGALLASELKWRFVDVDATLVDEHGIPVADLFAIHGEPGFRLLEAAAVRRTLLSEQVVIALGGGALESASTRECLRASSGTHVVFLETPLDLALARCAADGTVRPILADPSAVKARFEHRLEHYREAHHTLSTADRTPAELVQELRSMLTPMLAAHL